MKNLTKILSLTLIFVLLFSATLLSSCATPALTIESDTDQSAADNAISGASGEKKIIKMELRDDYLWLTYSTDPENPVKIATVDEAIKNSFMFSDGTLNYMPLANGAYGVAVGSEKYLTEIVIPETFNGKPVTAIVENAFKGCKDLKKITIPATINSVADGAFAECGNLEFNEYDNALYLGNESNPHLILVKAKNANITRCVVNKNAIAICDYAFADCKELVAIDFTNVKNIGSYAFKNCTSLVSEIKIPEGSTHIGPETFYGCANIKKVSIPKSVSNIGMSAFAGCSALESVTFAEGSLMSGFGNAVFYNCKKLKSITIPAGVKYIGDNKASNFAHGVFSQCDSLEKVVFADGNKLEQIGNFAFYACKKLSAITIPTTLTYLGNSAFAYSGLTSAAIPDGVTILLKETFLDCSSLKTVTLGKGLTKIGENAFASCLELNNLTIPASVHTIEMCAFLDNKNLTSLKFEDAKGWQANRMLENIKLDEAKVANPETMAKCLSGANSNSTTDPDYSFHEITK